MPYTEAEILQIVHERDALSRMNAQYRARLAKDLALLARIESELASLKVALRIAIFEGSEVSRWEATKTYLKHLLTHRTKAPQETKQRP